MFCVEKRRFSCTVYMHIRTINHGNDLSKLGEKKHAVFRVFRTNCNMLAIVWSRALQIPEPKLNKLETQVGNIPKIAQKKKVVFRVCMRTNCNNVINCLEQGLAHPNVR